jgi:hypothetical protein
MMRSVVIFMPVVSRSKKQTGLRRFNFMYCVKGEVRPEFYQPEF